MWEKVVLNLVSNAFKFTLAGGITVRLSKEHGHVRLAVQDTGSGIPPEELPRLFERFHRVEGTKGRTHEGTGIGLALVQELVKIHGGTVSVESEVGRGSTFTVTIPAGKDHLPAERIGGENALTSTSLDYNAFVVEAMRWLPETGEGDPGIKAEVSELDTESALLRGLGKKSVLSTLGTIIATLSATFNGSGSSSPTTTLTCVTIFGDSWRTVSMWWPFLMETRPCWQRGSRFRF